MDFKQGKSKLLGVLLMLILLAVIVMAVPIITKIFPTTSPYLTENDTIKIKYNISEENLNSSKLNWNVTNNYTAYDINYSPKGICNMDNLSSLGENNTMMHCWNEGDGYNITPNGDASPTENGKYNGGYYLDGSGDYLNMGSLATRYNIGNSTNNNSFTVGLWIKRDTAFDVSNSGIFDFNYDFDFRGFKYTYETGFMACFSRYGGCPSYSVNLNQDTWYHIVVVKNDSNMSSYLNGVFRSSSGETNISNMSFGTGNLLIGRTDGGNSHNGSLDDFSFYNKALTLEEIQGLYNAQITKHNSSSWSLNTEQNINTGMMLNSTQPLDDPFTYYVCATNSSGSEICTSEQTARRRISSISLTANFTNTIGIVNQYFYGVNDQYNQLGNNTGTFLDINCDGSSNTPSNVTWNRDLFEPTNMNSVRIWNFDINNIALSEGVYNETQIQYLMNTAEYVNSFGGEITYVNYGTPTWLANTTTPWCLQTSPFYSGDYASCPPINATKLAIISDYIIENLTQVIPEDKINFIPYNEAWFSFFLNNLSTDNITKAVEYGKIHNASFDYISASHPEVEIGWSVFTTLQTDVFSNYMMDNFSNKNNFTGMHYYDGTSYFKNPGWNIDDVVNDWIADCSTYGMDCSKLLFDEWDITIKWSLPVANYSMEVAYFYQYLLNNIPAQTQAFKFKWGARHGYGCDVGETEFPKNFPMVNEVNNTISPEYNVTKNFAASHPSSSIVYQSSASNANFITTSTKDGTLYAITVMNIDEETGNLTINLTGSYPYSTITNLLTEEVYNVNSNIAEVGLIDSYEILYLGLSVSGSGLVSKMDLNENSGTTAHDTSGNSNDGIITGATWLTDGILVTLIAITDYTINAATGLFTIVNTDYSWSELITTWSYAVISDAGSAADSMIDQFANYPALVGLVGTIVLLGLIIGILVVSFLFGGKKDQP